MFPERSEQQRRIARELEERAGGHREPGQQGEADRGHHGQRRRERHRDAGGARLLVARVHHQHEA